MAGERRFKPLERLEGWFEERRDDRRFPLREVHQTADPLRQAAGPHALKIVCLDVDHGDATLLILPSGRVALVDSAKDAWARRRVIPFLQRHQIGELAYYISTHLHEDHVGQRERILREFHVKQLWDYRSLETGAALDFEGTRLTVLNSFADSADENDRSLAFVLEYNGFSYTHGADLYADGQQRICDRFPELVRTHVYRANHHVHGSFSGEHLIAADPVVVVISAQEAVYQRVAYTRDFAAAVAEIRKRGGRLRDVCLTLERGNVLIYANGEDDWGHGCYRPEIVLADLYP